jgi:hypothetical protein
MNRTNKMSQVMIFTNAYLNLKMFRASLCPSSGEQSRSFSPDDGHKDARNIY